MAVNTTTFESTLQTKLNDTTLEAKEMLLLGKALESTVGSIAVSDINTAGATKVSEINTVATNTFKTVGGASILGSGDIATLPSQSGASGKVLKSDGTNAAWGTDEKGKILQVVQTVLNNRWIGSGTSEQLITGFDCSITPTVANSKIIVQYAFDTSSATSLTARTYMQRQIASASWANLAGIMGTGSTAKASLSHGGVYANWMINRHSAMYLDNPSYSLGDAVSYRIGTQSEGNSIYVGSTNRDNTPYHPRTASILILMEVAQ